MTDAAVPITQAVVERFTEQYLTSIGCPIEKHGDRWEVTVPDDIDTELPKGRVILICGDDPIEQDENEHQLHPSSSIFQRITADAGERTPAGKLTVDIADTRIEIPAWLQESDVDVTDASFRPYYDRTAAVMLFRISVETVSEYQQEWLSAIAIDARSKEFLPALEETFLGMTSVEGKTTGSSSVEIDRDHVKRLLKEAQGEVVNRIQPQIDEIHREASRAADAEIEEYRQMRQQRIEELEERASTLSSRIEGLNESIERYSGQEKRVQALQERKELKSEYEDVESELEGIRRRREHGFPEKQREIRNRHALEVVVTPLTITQVEYERGEAEIELAEERATRTLTIGYGSGVGVTEEVHCDSCAHLLSGQNPIQTIKGGLRCSECGTTTDADMQ